MNIRRGLLPGAMIISFLFSCKKENDEPLSITGFWKGAWNGNEIAILHRQDGTGRLFAFAGGITDTTKAGLKADGNWAFREDRYTSNFSNSFGITINMEAIISGPGTSIAGTVKVNGVPQLFYVIKQ